MYNIYSEKVKISEEEVEKQVINYTEKFDLYRIKNF